MGKVTGFLEIDRRDRRYAPAGDRVRHYREFMIPLSEEANRDQADVDQRLEQLRDVARGVDDPSGQGSVYAVWRQRSGVPDSAEPAMGNPGGGSDFAGFYNHLGIPIADWGFGGSGGVYHSAYDSYHWMRTFGDPGYKYHAAAARIGAAMVLRLANADVLPYDYVEYARTMRRHLPAVDSAIARAKMTGLSTAAVVGAVGRLERAAADFVRARDKTVAGPISKERASRANQALRGVERALTRPEGLRTRPWYRNLIYAADENNGYADVVFPSVSEAVRGGDVALAGREIADLASRFDAAARALDAARDALGGEGERRAVGREGRGEQ